MVIKRLVGACGAVLAGSLALSACGSAKPFPPGVPPVVSTVPGRPPRSSTSSVPTTRRSTVPPTTARAAPTTAQSTTIPTSTTTTVPSKYLITMQPAVPAAPGSPTWVAGKWVQAYYGVSYTWPDIGYWVTLAKPYMDKAMYLHYEYLATHNSDSGTTAYFAGVRRQDTVVMAEVESSGVEGDAPGTKDKRYVMVTFQLERFGSNEPQSGAPYGPVQALQVIVARRSTGSPWRVVSFNSPNAN